MYRHTLFYSVFHFIVLCSYCIFFFFYELKVCGNSALTKPTSAIFLPTVFARFVSLCHILVILAIFQSFSIIIIKFVWRSVISDLAENLDDSIF